MPVGTARPVTTSSISPDRLMRTTLPAPGVENQGRPTVRAREQAVGTEVNGNHGRKARL